VAGIGLHFSIAEQIMNSSQRS